MTRVATGLLLALFGVTACVGRAELEASGGKESHPSALIGGGLAEPGQWDSAVRLASGCTGVVVGPRHILTAAHCVTDADTGVPKLSAGEMLQFSNDKQISGSWRFATIARIHIPPRRLELCARGCTPRTLEQVADDVAVIELTASSEIDPSIDRALVDPRPIEVGHHVVQTGYGCEAEDGYRPGLGRLKYARVRVAEVGATILISAEENQGISGCDGDSGGPVYRSSGAGDLVVAVVTSGLRGVRTTYAPVATHQDWLRGILPPSSFLPPGRYEADPSAAFRDLGTLPLAAGIDARLTMQTADWTFTTGEHVDGYVFDCDDSCALSNMAVSIALRSDASDGFDTYLIVETPSGEVLQDDDSGGGTDSALSFTAEYGAYFVGVTSYAPGEEGAYQLDLTTQLE